MLRYGNYDGPGYAGGLGSETIIQHPELNDGNPILAPTLTQTPEGLGKCALILFAILDKKAMFCLE